jgi:dipeptidyl aminopeptidase/acylaminoacyl peptidase
MTMAALLDPQISPDDADFAFIRDDPRSETQRRLVEDLWTRYQPYADPTFQQKIARSCHPHFWEMYLACALMDQGHQLAPKRTDEGPDICILKSGHRIWVEAVAPGRGEGVDAVPFPPVGAEYVPKGKVILRLRSAIEEKWRKYQAYREAGSVLPDDPYVVAVNGGKVPYASAVGSGLPYIVQAVSRLGSKYISLDRETLEIREQGYTTRPFVQKLRGSPVSTGIFVDGGYEGISGVLYSDARILNFPVPNGSEFVFVHNALPTNPLEKGWVTGIEFWHEEGVWYSRANQGHAARRAEDAGG